MAARTVGGGGSNSSLEVEVIQENFRTIVFELEPVLLSNAATLLAPGLLSKPEHDRVSSLPPHDAAEEFVRLLSKKVEANAGSFSEFLSNLKDSKADLAEALESALNLKRKSTSELVTGWSAAASSLSSYETSSDWVEPKSVANLKTSSEETPANAPDKVPVGRARDTQVEEVQDYFTQNPRRQTLGMYPMNMDNKSFEDYNFDIRHSEPALQDACEKYSIEESKDDSSRWKYVFWMNDPLAQVKDQTYWRMDQKVKKDLSVVSKLDQKLDNLTELEVLKQELIKEKADKEQALKQRDQAVQEKDQAVYARMDLAKMKMEKEEIVKKLEAEIMRLKRNLKYEKDFAENYSELYFKAAEQLRKTTEKLKKESNGTV